MRALGIKCTKDKLDWAVVEGSDRGQVKVVDRKQVPAPSGTRGAQLVWVRKEVHELLVRYSPDAVAVRVAEGGGLSVSLGRSEVEGVVQEALKSAGIEPTRHVAASIRSAYSAQNAQQLEVRLKANAAIAGTPSSRRDPVVSAVAMLPK